MNDNPLFSTEEKKLNHIREVWRVSLETQMHFNELLIKMRTTVISIILAVFSAAAFIIRDIPKPVEIYHFKIHASAIALIVGIIFLVCQYIIDRYYYLKLLMGAVDYTKKIDEEYQDKYGNNLIFGLTKCISDRITENSAMRVLFAYYAIPIILASIVVFIIEAHINNLIIAI